MQTTARLFSALSLVGLAGCPGGAPVPTENVRDYNLEFSSAEASESCPQELQDDAASHTAYSLTYRLYWIDGPDEPRVDLYWKALGDADSAYSFLASGTLVGTLEDGVIDYAGGSFQEDRGSARVTYRIEGRARLRFCDEIPDSSEDYVIQDSTDTAEYPIGCVYTLYYNGHLDSEEGGCG